MWRITLTLVVMLVACAIGQDYRCDWNVNGIAGGDMSSANYRCGSTCGQTAAGQLTGPDYWAMIGFWQTDGQVGIKEAAERPEGQAMQARLYAPAPNPFGSRVAIRYSLAAPGPASLSIYDQTGRLVREFVLPQSRIPSPQSLTWDGKDSHGRVLANGIYFCRMTAEEYQGTQKLVLQR